MTLGAAALVLGGALGAAAAARAGAPDDPCAPVVPARQAPAFALAGLAAGAALVALTALPGPPPAPALVALVAVLAAAGAVDQRTLRIPNRLSLVAAALAVGAALEAGAPWPALAAGGLVVGLTALAAWRFGGMGMGDVKLLAAVGLALGPIVGLFAFALAAALGGGAQTARRLLGARPGPRFAFAPYVAVAFVACLAVGRVHAR